MAKLLEDAGASEKMWNEFAAVVRRLTSARSNFWGLVESQNLAPWASGETMVNAEPRVIEAVGMRKDGHSLCELLEADYRVMVEMRNALVERLVPVIRQEARRQAIKHHLDEMTVDDLVQDGAIGVIKGSQYVSVEVNGSAYSAYRYLRVCIGNEISRRVKNGAAANKNMMSLWDVGIEEEDESVSIVDNIADEAPSAESQMINQQFLDSFRSCWKSSSKKLRVVELIFDGLTDSEIVETIDDILPNEIRKIRSDVRSMAMVRG